jgi:hypothetical protein
LISLLGLNEAVFYLKVILKVITKYFLGVMTRMMRKIASIFEITMFILNDDEATSMRTVAALILTPMIGGAHYYLNNTVSELAMIMNYLGCLGCAMFTIYNVEKAFVEFANLPHDPKPGPNPNVKKKREKKKYKIKGHCYKRNYKRKFSYDP